MEIKILRLPHKRKKTKPSDVTQLGFGRVFTDRMFLAEWKPDLGWHNARIKPYEPLVLDPSALIFHYGQEIFEGLKAYRWKDASIALFRPEMNARRFNFSASRLSMPEVPESFFIEAIEKLVFLEKDWIPSEEGTSLYIRPVMIAVEPVLGVRPSSHYFFFIILSPVGAYYASGFNPIKICVEDRYVRAAPGGTGEAKTGGNYASSLKAIHEAKNKGFDQVLWLDGAQRRFIEEIGAMNMFFVYKDRLVTPPLKGSILQGVTRDSILKLVHSFGFKAEEKELDIDEVMADIKMGRIVEAFGSGTAAVVTPVGVLSYKDTLAVIHEGKTGPFVKRVYETLTQIQYGQLQDPYNWMRKIPDFKKPRESYELKLSQEYHPNYYSHISETHSTFEKI